MVHYQAANRRTDIASKFVVFMLCAPDVPMMTYLDETEIHERAPAALDLRPNLQYRRVMSDYDVEAVDRLPFTTPEKSARYRTEDYQGAVGLNWYSTDPPCRPRWLTIFSPTSSRSPSLI